MFTDFDVPFSLLMFVGVMVVTLWVAHHLGGLAERSRAAQAKVEASLEAVHAHEKAQAITSAILAEQAQRKLYEPGTLPKRKGPFKVPSPDNQENQNAS